MSLTVVLLMVGAPLLLVMTGPVAAQDNILLATRTEEEIVPNGVVDEAAWEKAIPADVELDRGSNNLVAELRALYDDQYIYMAFTWEDESKSVIPQQWQYTGGSWASIPHKEDRLSILWNTDDSIIGFEQNKQACTAACHNDEFKTGTSDESGDLWQWMAGRTNPSTQVPDIGWMDDLSLGDQGITPDDFTGSKVWEMNSVYANDDNGSTVPFTQGDEPKWMEGNPPPNPDPNFLFRGFETDITDQVFDDGTNLPGYLLSKPSTGKDRADISAKAVYDEVEMKWTLEIKRKLDTGHDGDVSFANLLNTYHFGLSVFDNQAGGVDTHYNSALVTLRFEVPELAVLSAVPSLETPIIGDEINVTVKVKNLGGYSTGLTVAMTDAADTEGEPIDERPYVEMLSGFEEEFNFTWDTTGVDPGKHTLVVKADSDDLIAEQDKDNNVMEVDIWVYPPISEFKVNKKEPEEGQKVKLIATITNPADEEINVTVVFYEGETILDTQVHNVSAGETLEATFEWKADKEGKYTFRVAFDGADNTMMELKVNVKAGSPGPGLLMAMLAITLAAAVALVARRHR